MRLSTYIDEVNNVQLRKLNNAALAAAKLIAVMEDMKIFAEKPVVEDGVKGASAGTLNPNHRFEGDKDVPPSTRY
jgi:hypothetical protein